MSRFLYSNDSSLGLTDIDCVIILQLPMQSWVEVLWSLSQPLLMSKSSPITVGFWLENQQNDGRKSKGSPYSNKCLKNTFGMTLCSCYNP